MNIQEMHQSFRVFGQQMGMQLIRAILPEEIDEFLNASIIDKVRELILSNVNTIHNDRISTQNNPISPINYLRTLYRSDRFALRGNVINIPENVMHITGFAVQYRDSENLYNCRLIEPDKLENTLNDFCNGASKEYPICSIYSNGNDELVRVYSGNIIPDLIVIKYIKTPKRVSLFDEIDCDLPEYTHNEIVQLAVNKYFVSLGSTSHSVNQ